MIRTARQTTVFLISGVWALALIASAIFLKGNPAKDWVQTALYLGALLVLLSQGKNLSCNR